MRPDCLDCLMREKAINDARRDLRRLYAGQPWGGLSLLVAERYLDAWARRERALTVCSYCSRG